MTDHEFTFYVQRKRVRAMAAPFLIASAAATFYDAYDQAVGADRLMLAWLMGMGGLALLLAGAYQVMFAVVPYRKRFRIQAGETTG